MANDLQHFTGDADDTLPVAPGLGALPALVLSAGEHGTYRFLEFFAAHIRNPNTRAAYFRDVCAFFRWCQRRQIRALSAIRSHHVAGYIERLGTTHAPPSVKQHLAAMVAVALPLRPWGVRGSWPIARIPMSIRHPRAPAAGPMTGPQGNTATPLPYR